MARLDFLIFGYRRYEIESECSAEISSQLLRRGISATIESSSSFTARERDREAVLDILEKFQYRESRPLGLWGMIKRYPHKIAITAAAFLSFICIFYFSGLIWDIRVEGNESLSDAAVIAELNACGFAVGKNWSSTETDKIELEMLEKSDSIGWISINRRGTVAYVTVIEKEKNDLTQTPDESLFGNIVATKDCIIEQISVKSGQALVEVGDTVKAGDILILGVLPEEVGEALCRAEGNIIGRVSEEIVIEVDRNYEQKEEIASTCQSLSILFFDRNINIFKNYGNLPDDCVIIEEISTISLFGKCKLPITLSKKECKIYQTQQHSYSDDELVSVALSRLRAKTAQRLENSDLLKIRSDGQFTENGYKAVNHITLSENVGSFVPFEVE